MCFSATASFSAAAVIGGIGAVTIWKTARPGYARLLPFATIPLLLAAQQITEGFLWLEIVKPVAGTYRPILIHGFIGYAEIFWPVFAPFAAFLIEPVALRRRMILACLVCGVILSAYLLSVMIAHPYHASIHEDGIVYRNGYPYPWVMWPVYVITTTASFSLSSYREVRIYSRVLFIGLAAAAIFYNRAYVSVWCFFAAVASTLVYLHISRIQDYTRHKEQ